MKAFTERNPKWIGGIALVVMAAVILAVIFLNRNIFSSGYQISAKFSNAAGVAKGTDVLLAGVDVGSVDSVSIDGNAVDVTMTIHNGVVLPSHTAADIQVETLLGVVDVTLDPVSGWSHPLQGGAFLTDTSVPTEFYQLNNIAGHLLEHSNAKAFNELVEDMAKITAGKQQQVAEIIEGLGKLTTTVSDRSGQVSQLIDSANTLATTLAQHDQQLATAITQLNTVAAGLAGNSTNLADLIDNVDAMATQTNSLLANDRPELDTLIKNLTATLGVVSAHQDDLAQAVSYLGAAIKGFSSIGYSGTTPLTWANIYVSTTGTTDTQGLLGACGEFTTILDDVLGPTPLPCGTRTGHPAGTTLLSGAGGASGTSSGTSATGSSPGATSSGSTSTGTGTPLAGFDSGLSGLTQLFDPLTGKVG